MKKTALYASVMIALAFISCKKDTNSAPLPTPYFVRLTDAPGDFTEVNIDLRGVEITGQGKSGLLNVNPGIYNLLDYTNGIDTLIATGSISGGEVQQIRLLLGQNNSVVVDSVSYPLTIPSGSESGLKIQVHQTLQPNVPYRVLLDFDANKSVILNGNGSYHLKPVIRAAADSL